MSTISQDRTPGSSDAVGAPTTIVKVVFASVVGTAVEWYDFFLYGSAAKETKASSLRHDRVLPGAHD